ncbi:MAG: hypothetical protein D8B38_04730, partial [Candidatus Saccharimonas sp.]
GVAHPPIATPAALAQLAATMPTPSEAKKARQEEGGIQMSHLQILPLLVNQPLSLVKYAVQ